MVNPVRII